MRIFLKIRFFWSQKTESAIINDINILFDETLSRDIRENEIKNMSTDNINKEISFSSEFYIEKIGISIYFDDVIKLKLMLL